MSYILNILICAGMILLDNLLQYLMFIGMIDLSRTCGSTASLICNALLMFIIYSWIKIKLKGSIFPTVTVCGPAQHSLFGDFIIELSRKYLVATLPVVLGGDFNLIRSSGDKNNDKIDLNLMEKFNMFIDLHQLQEIRSGPR
jgi:hypothetical protein